MEQYIKIIQKINSNIKLKNKKHKTKNAKKTRTIIENKKRRRENNEWIYKNTCYNRCNNFSIFNN